MVASHPRVPYNVNLNFLTLGDFVSLRGEHADIWVGGASERETRLDGRRFRERNVDAFALKLGRIVILIFDDDVEAERKARLLTLRHAGEVGLRFPVQRAFREEEAGVVDEEIVASAAVDADQFERRRKELRRKSDSDATNPSV